jgi:NADP-dependent 3-hydroxy acid dehydrogenase YdfG
LSASVARLEGKVVCLTGAGAGIAKATARACAREGAAVALFEVDRAVGESAARQIVEEGGRALFVHTDVTQDDSVRSRMPGPSDQGRWCAQPSSASNAGCAAIAFGWLTIITTTLRRPRASST